MKLKLQAEQGGARSLTCPYCHYEETRVLDSRPAEEGHSIRRRRECLACGQRFTTYEKVESRPFLVIKKDGRREPFDHNKLLAGLLKACEKRPVAADTLEAVVGEVERGLVNSGEREVSSHLIGEMVMDRLRNLDDVAYVRFASVYREFKDLQAFLGELQNLIREK